MIVWDLCIYGNWNGSPPCMSLSLDSLGLIRCCAGCQPNSIPHGFLREPHNKMGWIWYPTLNFGGSSHWLYTFHVDYPKQPGSLKKLEEWLQSWENGEDEVEDHLDDDYTQDWGQPWFKEGYGHSAAISCLDYLHWLLVLDALDVLQP